MSLFDPPERSPEELLKQRPLAARMRPQHINDVAGQHHLLGKGKLLRRAIEADRLGSLILYGPPGCGKTTLAEVIAATTSRRFTRLSAITANVSQLRERLVEAKQLKRLNGTETILFIDEIHRFNKSQQDALLPFVEEGDVTLIGATTHNPFFFVNSPLVSRSQVFQLEPLSREDITELLKRALAQDTLLSTIPVAADESALAHLASVSEGDARKALNALEIAALSTPPNKKGSVQITLEGAADSIQKKAVVYDRDEDQHYDTISAFIKSVRGSDPDAAVYWLAKMLYAGEDPRFIARRLIILASEDIGNADPMGLVVATNALKAVEFVGMPEARIILSQATTYLATAWKSNAAYRAIENALTDVKEGRTLSVPKHLRDKHYKGATQLGHTGYQYAHDFEGHVVDQEYIPTDATYYNPENLGHEKKIIERIAYWDRIRKKQREQT